MQFDITHLTSPLLDSFIDETLASFSQRLAFCRQKTTQVSGNNLARQQPLMLANIP